MKNLKVKNKEINFQGTTIKYKLRKSKRAKKIRMTISCELLVVVTLPYRVNEKFAEKFILEKINWLIEKIDFFKKFDNGNLKIYNRDDYLQKKEKAFLLVKERLEFFNEIYKLSYNKIFIKNQKTRWGSCSSIGNLNYNYKIIYLPADMVDYIVVHELCHLKEFNHSHRFWNLVYQTIPDYLQIRKELKYKFLG